MLISKRWIIFCVIFELLYLNKTKAINKMEEIQKFFNSNAICFDCFYSCILLQLNYNKKVSTKAECQRKKYYLCNQNNTFLYYFEN